MSLASSAVQAPMTKCPYTAWKQRVSTLYQTLLSQSGRLSAALLQAIVLWIAEIVLLGAHKYTSVTFISRLLTLCLMTISRECWQLEWISHFTHASLSLGLVLVKWLIFFYYQMTTSLLTNAYSIAKLHAMLLHIFHMCNAGFDASSSFSLSAVLFCLLLFPTMVLFPSRKALEQYLFRKFLHHIQREESNASEDDAESLPKDLLFLLKCPSCISKWLRDQAIPKSMIEKLKAYTKPSSTLKKDIDDFLAQSADSLSPYFAAYNMPNFLANSAHPSRTHHSAHEEPFPTATAKDEFTKVIEQGFAQYLHDAVLELATLFKHAKQPSTM